MNNGDNVKTFAIALLLGLSTLQAPASAAAAPAIEHLEPPFWWAGMHNSKLQLMVHGARIADLQPSLNYKGVRIAAVTRVASPNYLFIDLEMDQGAAPGAFDIAFKGNGRSTQYRYQLRQRAQGSAARHGFDSTDVIYLLMPDRFANGDPSNDSVAGMADKGNRALGYGRHGGDIQGMIDRLGYIKDMGFTQLWPTPLVVNDMPSASYHGYAATDHYKIDPRYGSNADYLRLSGAAREKGIGLIQDVVLSHIGIGHWWMKDKPTPDWVNHADKFVGTAHHHTAVQDPYASNEDKENFTTGWFAPTMPDLNQTNPLVANYLIQNNIWWIENASLSGLRIDTFGYSDGAFLTEYTRRVMAEYPNLNLVGEEWHKQPAVVAHWQKGKVNPEGYVSSMPSMMDFPMTEAMRDGLADSTGNNVFSNVYETLSLDYLYPNPGNLVVFAGNHDTSRIYSVVGEDMGKYKMDIVFLMTMPRIPQFYSGDEILMTSSTKERNDSSYRTDFPGGWKGDTIDAFSGRNLGAKEAEAQAFVKKLVNWRRTQTVIHHGKMMHYGAQDNTYVYFRYDGAKKVMVAFNNNPGEKVLDAARFREMLKGVAGGVDVLTGARFDLRTEVRLPARSAVVLELN
jgi:glycosidase